MKKLIIIAATIAALSSCATLIVALISCASNKDAELLNAYKAYYKANEALLDTLDSHYDFMDAEGEGDGYADYQAAKDRIDSLTIK